MNHIRYIHLYIILKVYSLYGIEMHSASGYIWLYTSIAMSVWTRTLVIRKKHTYQPRDSAPVPRPFSERIDEIYHNQANTFPDSGKNFFPWNNLYIMIYMLSIEKCRVLFIHRYSVLFAKLFFLLLIISLHTVWVCQARLLFYEYTRLVRTSRFSICASCE